MCRRVSVDTSLCIEALAGSVDLALRLDPAAGAPPIPRPHPHLVADIRGQSRDRVSVHRREGVPAQIRPGAAPPDPALFSVNVLLVVVALPAFKIAPP